MGVDGAPAAAAGALPVDRGRRAFDRGSRLGSIAEHSPPSSPNPAPHLVAPPQLVYLVNQHKGVAGLGGLQALDHLSGHGAHVRAAVACGAEQRHTACEATAWSAGELRLPHPGL